LAQAPANIFHACPPLVMDPTALPGPPSPLESPWGSSAQASPLRYLVDVSPVCIRRERAHVAPVWRHAPTHENLEESLDVEDEERQQAEDAKAEKQAAKEKHKQQRAVHRSVGGLFGGAGAASVADFRPLQPLTITHSEGALFTVKVERNLKGESGFHVWPDFMTICSLDRGRKELKNMQEGDIVIAVDGIRVGCIADYMRFASGVVAFSLTMLRCDDPSAEIISAPCTQCHNKLFMPASLFCAECGTKRPELLLSSLQNC